MNEGQLKTIKVKHPDSSEHFLIVNVEDAYKYVAFEEVKSDQKTKIIPVDNLTNEILEQETEVLLAEEPSDPEPDQGQSSRHKGRPRVSK